jgi:hypothetical protein
MESSTEEATMSTITIGSEEAAAATDHYKSPDWFTTHVFNKVVAGLTRMGVSGELHHTPVNLLDLDGTQYLVAPRGETQWVRNVRHSDGHMVLILGRRRQICRATEIAPADAVPVLRAYLRKWKFEVGMFFDGITPDATDEEWALAAPKHPVFKIG